MLTVVDFIVSAPKHTGHASTVWIESPEFSVYA